MFACFLSRGFPLRHMLYHYDFYASRLTIYDTSEELRSVWLSALLLLRVFFERQCHFVFALWFALLSNSCRSVLIW
jgi:hypothetical protein